MVFALIHSPLVSTFSWYFVKEKLNSKGYQVIVPRLVDSQLIKKPFWKQHADSAAKQINRSTTNSIILVGHSGAGPILPAIGDRLSKPPTGYIFIDAGLPMQGLSRLEMMRLESIEWADGLQNHLDSGGSFPEWSENDLKPIIPSQESRQRVINELTPQGLSFFSEKIVFSNSWTSKPSAYLQLSQSYATHTQRAKELAWLVEERDAGHFDLLVEPTAVSDFIIKAGKEMSGFDKSL